MPGSKFSSVVQHKDGEGIGLPSSSICPLCTQASQYTGGQSLRPWIHFSHLELCYINNNGVCISPEVIKTKTKTNSKTIYLEVAPSLVCCWPGLYHLSLLLLQSPFDLRANSVFQVRIHWSTLELCSTMLLAKLHRALSSPVGGDEWE